MAGRRGIGLGVAAIAVVIVVASFALTFALLETLWPRAVVRPIVVAAMPPLPAVSRTSTVIAPVTIPLAVIRDAVERAAPRNLSGTRDNPLRDALGKAEIGWTLSRGALSVSGRPEAMAFSTPLTGALRTTGTLADKTGNVTGKLSSALSANLGREIEGLTSRSLDQRADLRGTVTMTSHPILTPNWRIAPNLAAQVSVGDTSVSIAGVKLRVNADIKPMIDKAVGEQVATLEQRLRGDAFIETAARREWAKMCRSLSLKGAAKDAPDLFLEMRPVRAFAAQPRIDAATMVITLGVEAETRVVPAQTTPSCPFPRDLAIVPPLDDGRVAVAIPVDMPFTEVNRLISAQLIGRDFSAPAGGVAVTVLAAQVAPAGERLLIALRVKAREQTSWLGLGAEASVNVWGRPVLDPALQMLRLTDITLDVDSQTAFGLLGVAARAAVPYLQAAIADRATIDLAPFAAEVRRAIENSLGDFRRNASGTEVDAAVTGVRLAALDFDATTLRVIAEVDGTAKVVITSLAP